MGRAATEDLTGIGMADYHESLSANPYQLPVREKPPVRTPENIKAQREALRMEWLRVSNTNAAWFKVPDELRCLLIALCTERSTERAHMVKWSDLTEVEKTTIGVQARSFVRGLGKVAEVLR